MIDETPLLTEEQARWLFMLRRIQLDRGYRPAWIAHVMQDRFGMWSELSPEALGTGIAPHVDVLAVVEAKLERGRGPVATVLVQDGTLSVGDNFIAGPVSGKVRALIDDRGRPVRSAAPSTRPSPADRDRAMRRTDRGLHQ